MGHKSNSNFIFQIFQQNRSVHTTKSNTTVCCLIFLFHIKESKAEHRHKIRTLRLVSSPTFLRYQTEATSSNINFCYHYIDPINAITVWNVQRAHFSKTKVGKWKLKIGKSTRYGHGETATPTAHVPPRMNRRR